MYRWRGMKFLSINEVAGTSNVPGMSSAVVSELHFRRVVEPGYLPRALPKLDILIISQLPGLLHRRVIIGAFQG